MNDFTTSTPYGYCHCGCGQKTNIAPVNNKSKGWVRGQPLKYIVRHRERMSRSLSERFWERVIIASNSDQCWEWTGSFSKKTGYGQISKGKKNLSTHRVAWELTYGQIPNGLLICHTCDNHKCVNPKHLFLGTYSDNARDMVQKGRNNPPRLKGELSGRAKLTNKQILYIRERYAVGDISMSALGREMNISGRHISFIVNRKSWKHI